MSTYSIITSIIIVIVIVKVSVETRDSRPKWVPILLEIPTCFYYIFTSTFLFGLGIKIYWEQALIEKTLPVVEL